VLRPALDPRKPALSQAHVTVQAGHFRSSTGLSFPARAMDVVMLMVGVVGMCWQGPPGKKERGELGQVWDRVCAVHGAW
jgi:hypothetical protein